MLAIFSAPILASCAGHSISVEPVKSFEAERYLGTWYEVARLDHVFERGLSDVTATYTRRDDGKVTVLNKGFKARKQAWSEAKGKAKFAGDKSDGHLKVSFFGPFYGDYIIFGLDEINYSRAYISGGRDNYLWLLSRTPNVTNHVRKDFLERSRVLGYNTDNLIWVDQSKALLKTGK